MLRLVLIDGRVAHDRQPVTDFAEMRGGSIQNDRFRATLRRDGIGLEALSIGQIAAENPFIREKPALFHEGGIDTEAAFVIEAGACHAGAMNFRFQDLDLHKIARLLKRYCRIAATSTAPSFPTVSGLT
jgi:hypothetical protein